MLLLDVNFASCRAAMRISFFSIKCSSSWSLYSIVGAKVLVCNWFWMVYLWVVRHWSATSRRILSTWSLTCKFAFVNGVNVPIAGSHTLYKAMRFVSIPALLRGCWSTVAVMHSPPKPKKQFDVDDIDVINKRVRQ